MRILLALSCFALVAVSAPAEAAPGRAARGGLRGAVARRARDVRQALRQVRAIASTRLPRGRKARVALRAFSGSLGLRRPAPVLLYQGAFDPVHRGHLANLQAALAGVRGASRVFVVPTSKHPGKKPAAHRHRVAMLRRAIASLRLPPGTAVEVVADKKLAEVSEAGFKALSAAIHAKHPGAAVYITTGADAYLAAAKRGLVRKALGWGYRYAVTPRAGYSLPDKLPAGVEVMPRSGGGQSSSAVREQLAAGRWPGGSLAPGTAAYIGAHGLYGARATTRGRRERGVVRRRSRRGLRVIGVTGGIAAGKSTVCKMLAAKGIPVVDADQLARRVVSPGSPTLAKVVERFGKGVLDGRGRLDRKRLGKLVFADPRAKRDLERIMFPAIATAAEQRFAALARRGHRLALYEAAMLVESSNHRNVDALLVVTAAKKTRVARLMQRNQLSRSAALARLAAQLPQAAKVKLADYVVDNSGTLARTRSQVERLLPLLEPRSR